MKKSPLVPMRHSLNLLFVASLICFAGCHAGSAPVAAASDKETPRQQFNLGYSLLYQEAKGLTNIKYVVAIKSETDEVEHAAKAMTDYCSQVRDEMEHMTGQYPGLRIDLMPMSRIEAEGRTAMGKERFSSFMPLIGQTGMEYERNLLLMIRDAADEESHIAGALAATETDAALKRYAEGVQTHFHALNQRLEALLERHYFVHPVKS